MLQLHLQDAHEIDSQRCGRLLF